MAAIDELSKLYAHTAYCIQVTKDAAPLRAVQVAKRKHGLNQRQFCELQRHGLSLLASWNGGALLR